MWLIQHWYKPIIGPFGIQLGYDKNLQCSHKTGDTTVDSNGRKYYVFRNTLYRVDKIERRIDVARLKG